MEAVEIIRSAGIPLFEHDDIQDLSLQEIAQGTGMTRTEALEGLLKLMERTYIPLFLNQEDLSEVTRTDLRSRINKFMVSLTDAVSESRGRTVLYIPEYLIPSDVNSAVKDKDLIQQIESTMIHWTRKIKEVIYEAESVDGKKENAGPLDEIAFWKERSEDLNGISEQLESAQISGIISMLELSKSAYLPQFLSLRHSIQREAICADDNLKFLLCLQEPCEKLSKASPVEIPSTLPLILNTIRVIWNLSRFYNTTERITSLLSKLSNDVINRCRAHIDQESILSGDVDVVMRTLEESIEAGKKWKKIYEKVLENMRRTSAKQWDFDSSYVFSNVNAFVQRCVDLQEVCIAQLQFAPRSTTPIFKGLRGPQIRKNLTDIYEAFESLVGKLRDIGYDMLDVKQTQWLDDFSKFRAGVKDFEIMFNNVLSHALDGVSSLEDKSEVLRKFCEMAKTEVVKRAVTKKTSAFYKSVLLDVNQVKSDFDLLRRSPYSNTFLPKFSGSARSATCLMRRLDEAWSVVTQSNKLLPDVHEYIEVQESYTLTHQSIEQYVADRHQEWFASIHSNIAKGLENSLLVHDKESPSKLLVHFDLAVSNTLQEVRCWESLRLGGPYVAMEINAQREKYKVLRDTALSIVRQYNTIVGNLDEEEKKLFRDRLKALDKKVLPGTTKLKWTTDRHTLEFYFKEAGRQCKESLELVTDFKEVNKNIETLCTAISNMSLVSVEVKNVYSILEFEDHQKKHLSEIKQFLTETSDRIKACMKKVYGFFEKDSDEIQIEWTRYTERIDTKVEIALKKSVKRSLQEISKCLNGEKRKEAVPIFFVMLVLEKNNRVELQPTIQCLFDMVHGVSRELVAVIKTVARVRVQRSEKHALEYKAKDLPLPPDLPTFYEMISNDEDTTLKTIVQITNGITSIVDKVQQFLNYWERKYKLLWDQDKDAYIRRYEKANKPLSSFIADITKHLDVQEEVIAEDVMTNMKFLRIDCGPLKQSLISHCAGWVHRFTTLLQDIAHKELTAIHSYFETNTVALAAQPKTLEELSEMVKLHRKLEEDKSATEGRFEPLRAKYSALERFEVPVSDETHASLESIEQDWHNFTEMLDTARERLELAKDIFREKVKSMVEQFKTDLKNDVEGFKKEAPYGDENHSTMTALAFIETSEDELERARTKAKELKDGMDIFGIMTPSYQDLEEKENETKKLRMIWESRQEWENLYETWKDKKFCDLEVESMEEAALRISRLLVKQGREIGHWTVWKNTKTTLESFKQTMGLVSDLRNPALRQRHWNALIDEIGTSFDPYAEDFTLDTAIKLRLDLFTEFISELSTNASKELAIEQSIKQIEETWESLELQLTPYKETMKIKTTEDLFSALEDNLITISTIKASKFLSVFSIQVMLWEKTLADISETTELILQVQKNWMYLENIFIGSEDIQKQLPNEHALFTSVHEVFLLKMKVLEKTKLVRNVCCSEEIQNAFITMDEKLEKVQKSLDEYLEQKRQQFPRFYFLSSDDLLEILGQAKDPFNVQPHLKKCFEGIKKLDIQSTGIGEDVKYHSHGLWSPDGEYLPFDAVVTLSGPSEEWLNDVEAAMFQATRTQLSKTLDSVKSSKKEKWVKEHHGQMVITAGQILWTEECEKALSLIPSASSGKALRVLKKKWISYLNKLTTLTRSELTKLDRNKVVALITIEVHARDVIEQLIKHGCTAITDFKWVSQLRFYTEKDTSDCIVKQVLSRFKYGYEYQGNNGRLVITPLTDRCYMTLGAAMFTRRGGNPLGPAGTGKTETVKDFGKALGRFVVVFNCSDGIDYKMTERIFSGLAQSGAWACLDEFNRIEVEVLSVVSTQIASLMQAIKQDLHSFDFFGQTIRLIPSCAVFVTMNPGYAGRSDLPDNLKALLRPISMMVPDFTLIAEIMMFSEGFSTAKSLAKKMIAIMELSQQQLSKQDHYDYGLRSFVIPIARAAGALRRTATDLNEEVVMYKTMLDLISPKLVYDDLPIFMDLLADLFPGMETPTEEREELLAAIEQSLRQHDFQVVDQFVSKVVQIFDCKASRHGNMIVGKTGAGKTTAWRTLQEAMTVLHQKHPDNEQYASVRVHAINPLALSTEELYGSFDSNTNEWKDGVLANTMRKVCKEERKEQNWILFDGPVDPLWIESMNTLLDDNKLLTLISGERISMPPQVSMLFEVEDLSQASPATVSRAGMIYLNVEDLGWRPSVSSWVTKKCKADQWFSAFADAFWKLVDKYLQTAINFKKENCQEIVSCDTLSSVHAFTKYFDCFVTSETLTTTNKEQSMRRLEMWFLFCIMWSIGGTLNEEGRQKFDSFLRDIDPQFPVIDTVYEYFVDEASMSWLHWETKLSDNYKPPPLPFFTIMVPTVDSLRNKFLLSSMVSINQNILLVGQSGCGKTVSVLNSLDDLPENKAKMILTLSAQTSSNTIQEAIESRMEKRTRGLFGPVGGKQLVCFIDDLNMPQKSTFGFIPPLELLKLWNDHGFWYDRCRCEPKNIADLQLIGAMAPPGGGRNTFSQRIQACFTTLCITDISNKQLQRIYSTLLANGLSKFDYEVRSLGDKVVQTTIELYRNASKELLPTPTKSHYLFNTRDVARIIEGILRARHEYVDTKESFLQLWVHESFRVLRDRVWDSDDQHWIQDSIAVFLKNDYGVEWETLFPDNEVPQFTTFLRDLQDPPYEPVTDMQKLKVWSPFIAGILIAKTQEFVNRALEDYCLEPGHVAMDLVLFKEALHHLCRIHRVISKPRGNALLVGVGGSGRKSLTRLAAYISQLRLFSIEITKNYRDVEFKEDLKKLYRITGVENKPTVFLFDDSQIQQETFLESINNILTSGEVPGLFEKDELQAVLSDIQKPAKEAGEGDTHESLYAFFMERVRENLRVVLCMSPVGEAFRGRCRLFPGLVSCTTIDWFTDWPTEALYEVAAKQLGEESTVSPDNFDNISTFFAAVHRSVSDMSQRMLEEIKRHNYVTPTNYLETVRGYKHLMKEKTSELKSSFNKLSSGLHKLEETSKQVSEMRTVCEEKKVNVAKAKTDCEELLVKIVQDKRVADEQERQVNAKAEKIGKEAAEADRIATQVQTELDKALPALQAAEEALNVLTKKDMSELKAYAKPPALVELTLGGVMTVLARPATWDEAKKALGDPGFMEKLVHFDKDRLNDSLLRKVRKFTNNPDFVPESIGNVSAAARGLCLWVRAMEVYGNVAKDVAPKRERLKQAQEHLQKKREDLAQAQVQLKEVLDKVNSLRASYEESTTNKKALEDELLELEGKLDRAHKLVTGLAGEKARWVISIGELESKIDKLPGDVAIATAFMSYCGPFPSEYRFKLVHDLWIPQIVKLQIPATDGFDFASFMANPSDVRDWNIQGLPSDSFSIENGVMITRSRRWPLLIDPQSQGNQWIQSMERTNGLVVVNLSMADFIRQLENAIQFGSPVLLEDIKEELDPVLEPLLSKSFTKRGSQILIKLGDKEVDYNTDFKFYVTTKLPGPHYTPEISTKVMITNFAVKLDGLQEQLLNTVVQNERSDLYTQKNDLVVKVAQGKKAQIELEDQILGLLSSATGSLLDNIELINALDQSKMTYEEVNEALKVAEATAIEIDTASRQYEACAHRAAILFFILSGLSAIDSMYQFSLEAYKDLFNLSLKLSSKRDNVAERIEVLNDYHTYAFYKYTTRGLFEKHKLLLSLQMAIEITKKRGTLDNQHLQLFLRGIPQEHCQQALENPDKIWITDSLWKDIQCLQLKEGFEGLSEDVSAQAKKWEEWYRSKQPENAPLPGDWNEKCDMLKRLILVKCFRPDRIISAVTNFIHSTIGAQYAEPPMLDLRETYNDSTPLTPLVFILSPGVDPTDNLKKLSRELDMENRFFTVALGQGQAPLAARLIEDGLRKGHWIFLANCHLMTSWLPTLESMVKDFETGMPHEDFRLWLSSSPSPLFPMSILQRGIKMTTEPPKGLRSNLLRLYNSMDADHISSCKKPVEYQKLLFSLAYFHSVLTERKKFRFLGLNIPYDFNDTDFLISDDLLRSYLENYDQIPWEALRYLIAGANYGGRVTDELDRRVLDAYVARYFCPKALTQKEYRLSDIETYYIPADGSLEMALEYIQRLPLGDPPEAFGQHPNAEIFYLKEESHELVELLCRLQPQTAISLANSSVEDTVRQRVEDFVTDIPSAFDIREVIRRKTSEVTPLNVFLSQEVERYNTLITTVRSSCEGLLQGIQGLIVMSSDLERYFEAFRDLRVPKLWLKAYDSSKNLLEWKQNLLYRLAQIKDWIAGDEPTVFWITGFTYPAGFLTAVLQTFTRQRSIPVDDLSWEITVINTAEEEVLNAPAEGVLVRGVILESAGWDSKDNALCEPKPMELHVLMPILWFKPTEHKKRSTKRTYGCPMYFNSRRCGTTEHSSFVMNVELNSGDKDVEYWILRGTALLLDT